MILLLNIDFRSQLLKVLVGLFKDLKKTGVLLGVDHVDIGVKVIIFEGLDSISFILVLHHLLLLFFGLEGSLDKDSLFTNVVNLFLVKLTELLSVEEDFIQEFAVTSFFPMLLARTHLLLKAIESPRLLFTVGIDFGSLVKFAVNQLPLKKVVTLSLLSK